MLSHQYNAERYNFINEMGDITQLMCTWLWIEMRSQVATDDDECVSERARAKKRN